MRHVDGIGVREQGELEFFEQCLEEVLGLERDRIESAIPGRAELVKF